MNLKIKDIIRCTNGVLLTGEEEYECENFLRDTREVKKGDTFIGLKGKKHDGNLLWKEAFENGADTVILNKIEISKEEIEKYKDKNIIQVEDTIKAIQQIATEKRKLYKNLLVVGVTGSVGKTSTKDIIANVLSQKYKTLKTQGNMNNEIGLSLTVLSLRDHEAAVIEMGMNHLGEISKLSKIAKPTISVITNVGTSHIGNLGSRENILKAKLEILDGMDVPLLVVNNDNDMLNNWAKENENTVNIRTFGMENKSECMPENIEKKENESCFICNCEDDKFKLEVPVGGDVFILNALCGALVGKMVNLSNEEINDSYNASLDSMKAAIEYLSNTNANRKIAVLGDMFELGEYSEELHRKVGLEVAKNKIDLLFLIGNDSRYIAEEAEKNGMKKEDIIYFEEREELIEKLKNIMQKGDIILFKASNGMKLFEIIQEIV